MIQSTNQCTKNEFFKNDMFKRRIKNKQLQAKATANIPQTTLW